MEVVRRRYGLDLSEMNFSPLLPWVGLLGGAALLVLGLVRRSRVATGIGAACLGSSLVYSRVASGQPGAGAGNWRRLAYRPAIHLEGPRGVHVERAVTINRPVAELYRFWRNFENLPRFMRHLESVVRLDDQRSHWVVVGPAGMKVEWVAVIDREVENELIHWHSLEGSDVDNIGSVAFRPSPNRRDTEVKVVIQYHPPGGKAGAAFARLFGRDGEAEIREDLRRFKQLMEAGEGAARRPESSGHRQGALARTA